MRVLALMLILLVSGCVGVANNAPLPVVPYCPTDMVVNGHATFFEQCDMLHLEYDL